MSDNEVYKHTRKGDGTKYEKDKIKTCPVCGKKFTARSKNTVHYDTTYCSRGCASSLPKGGGRPTVMTEEVVEKLIEAYKWDATTGEACRYAGISESTYYDHYNKNKEFSEKIDRARDFIFEIAKKNIERAVVEGDTELSVKLLKMRQNKIYNERTVNEIEGEVGVKKADQIADALDDILEIKEDGNNTQTTQGDTDSM